MRDDGTSYRPPLPEYRHTAAIPIDAAFADELKNAGTATAIRSTIQLGEAKVEFPLDGADTAIAYLASR